MTYSTLLYEVSDDHVATITLNRPEAMNAFNQAMCEDFRDLWPRIRADDNVNAVVLRGAGERAFSAGLDRKRGYDQTTNVWDDDSPVNWLCPKLNRVWKPLICAPHGLVIGGALFWLNEADIIICSDDTIFADAHVSIGVVSARAGVGFLRRMPFAEAMRVALLGSDEYLSAQRAFEIGYITEIVVRQDLFDRAHELAALIAAKPAAAIQGTVKAMWESLDRPFSTSLRESPAYSLIGNPVAREQYEPPAPGTKKERKIR